MQAAGQGLLCTQDLDTATRVEMKLAEGSRLDLLTPRSSSGKPRDYEKSGDMRGGVLKLLSSGHTP